MLYPKTTAVKAQNSHVLLVIITLESSAPYIIRFVLLSQFSVSTFNGNDLILVSYFLAYKMKKVDFTRGKIEATCYEYILDSMLLQG